MVAHGAYPPGVSRPQLTRPRPSPGGPMDRRVTMYGGPATDGGPDDRREPSDDARTEPPSPSPEVLPA